MDALYFESVDSIDLLQLCVVFTFCIYITFCMKNRELPALPVNCLVSGIFSAWGRNYYQKAAQDAVPPQLRCFPSCTFPPCLIP